MAEQYQDDWSPFAVQGAPVMGNGFNPTCCELDYVAHVTHVDVALEVARLGRMKASLVYDKSRLNVVRLPVVWLSPNFWNPGSRYGNISFHVAWNALVAGMRFYWVGAIDYKPWAVRILVTPDDRSVLGLLDYDPRDRTGPWWYDEATDKHYWNSQFCLEVMFDGEVPLERVAYTTSVKHHEFRCNERPNGACPDAGNDKDAGMARFVAGLISRGLPTSTAVPPHEATARHVRTAWANKLRFLADGVPCAGSTMAEDAHADALVRATLGAYARRSHVDQVALLRLFASSEAYQAATARVIEETCALAPGTLSH